MNLAFVSQNINMMLITVHIRNQLPGTNVAENIPNVFVLKVLMKESLVVQNIILFLVIPFVKLLMRIIVMYAKIIPVIMVAKKFGKIAILNVKSHTMTIVVKERPLMFLLTDIVRRHMTTALRNAQLGLVMQAIFNQEIAVLTPVITERR